MSGTRFEWGGIRAVLTSCISTCFFFMPSRPGRPRFRTARALVVVPAAAAAVVVVIVVFEHPTVFVREMCVAHARPVHCSFAPRDVFAPRRFRRRR